MCALILGQNSGSYYEKIVCRNGPVASGWVWLLRARTRKSLQRTEHMHADAAAAAGHDTSSLWVRARRSRASHHHPTPSARS